MNWGPVGAVVLGFLCAGFTQVGAQHTTIRYEQTCRACTVTFDSVTTFGQLDGPMLLDPIGNVARDSRGRYFAIAFRRQQIAVFDSMGGFITAFGRGGDGPGEFGGTGLVALRIARGDTLIAFDASRRMTVFAPDHRWVRTTQLDGPYYGAAVLSTGEIVLNSSIRSERGAGLPFHIVASDGGVIGSFGASNPQVGTPSAPTLRRFFVSSSVDRVLWLWDPRKYALERWNVGGTRTATVGISAVPWFGLQTTEALPRGAS